jgi:hypothetical protein
VSSSRALHLMRLVVILVTCAHWIACLWWLLGSTYAPPDAALGDEHVGAAHALPSADGTSWVYRMDLEEDAVFVQYLASLYWALTVVVKSPWLHPSPPGEFAFACATVIMSAVLYAAFVGSITAVITSYTSDSSNYRDSLSKLRAFARSHGLSRSTTAEVISYFDAYWVELKGFDRDAMLEKIPSHMQPKVLMELHKPLFKVCDFLETASTAGAVAFLSKLRVEVCDTGDVLIHHGMLQDVMYILMRGELQLTMAPVPTEGTSGGQPQWQLVRDAQLNVRKRRDKADLKRATGRVDKPGTLIGFQVLQPRLQP